MKKRYAFCFLFFCFTLCPMPFTAESKLRGKKPLLDECVPILYQDLGESRFDYCVSPFDIENREEGIIINSQEKYQELIYSYTTSYFMCDQFTPPEIDFPQKSLLGKYVGWSACSVEILKHVCRNDLQRKIVYTITVVERGMCQKPGASMNWILIPKIPFGYTLEFDVQRRRVDQ